MTSLGHFRHSAEILLPVDSSGKYLKYVPSSKRSRADEDDEHSVESVGGTCKTVSNDSLMSEIERGDEMLLSSSISFIDAILLNKLRLIQIILVKKT